MVDLAPSEVLLAPAPLCLLGVPILRWLLSSPLIVVLVVVLAIATLSSFRTRVSVVSWVSTGEARPWSYRDVVSLGQAGSLTVLGRILDA